MKEEKKISIKQNTKRFLTVGAFVLLPILLFVLLESYEHNPFADIKPKAIWLNIALFELLAWILFFLSKSAATATRILSAIAMVFGLVNHYVMEFRSTPFVPWDIFSIQTAASVVDNYDFTPPMRVVIVTLVFLILIVSGGYIRLKLSMKWKYSLLCSLILSLGFVGFSLKLQDDAFQSKNGLYPFLFTPAHMTKVNGMAVTFTMDMAYIKVDKPSGYRAIDAQNLLQDMGYEHEQMMANTKMLPNVIVIMDEAFSDLAVLGEVNASQDYMPFIHSLMQGADNTVTGYLYVSVCGGNTANTEYEFLTGNSMRTLPTGSIPYQQYIKKEIPSVASALKELGYTTCAMHPYNSTGWNRNKVYPWMGFEQCIFLKDLQQVEKLRTYASDAYDFAQIIRIYEEKPENQPLFLFNVTMQNHGSYYDVYDNFTPDIEVEGKYSIALQQYLSLIKQTDLDFQELLSYFSKQNDPTVVIFFGDHQPADAVAKHIKNEATEEEKRYQVPYVIWANYDILEKTNQDMSANFLASYALEAAGIPLTDYQQFLLDVQDLCPIYSAVEIKKENENEESKYLIENYEKLQYYRLMDWKEE